MAVGAHHDDNELVAGTLARHKQAGWRVISVVMTDGRAVAGKISDENIAVRDNESLAAAALLGMEPVFLRLREGNLTAADETVQVLVRILRKYQPDVVITHPPKDYHLDHMNTSQAVSDAVLRCGSICFDSDLPPCPAPILYYSAAWLVSFEPDEYVDISDFIDLKLDALRCHKSQIPEDWKEEDTMLGQARRQCRMRGSESGVKYAEAFRRVPQVGNMRMSELLG
jgi:LmbE family N-acetylglucosaminyl deacetylase